MISRYLDSSVVVKRYVDEAGSAWLRGLLAPAADALVFTSRLTAVETVSAFARRLRDGTLTTDEFTALRDAFLTHCLDEYQLIPVAADIITLSCALLERRPLRAYDAVHLATALVVQGFLARRGQASLTFLSADDRLNRAAAVEGLPTDDPNQHA